MTSKREAPTPGPVGSESTARNDLEGDAAQASAEDGAEESTEEWTVDALSDELVELDPDGRAEGSGRAVVAAVIDDGSTGAAAATPVEKAARRARRDTVPSVLPSMLAKSMRPANAPLPGRPPGPPPGRPAASVVLAQATAPAASSLPARDPAAPAAAHADVTRKVVDADAGAIPSERHSAAYSIEMVAQVTGDVHTAQTAEQQIPSTSPVATLVKKACFCLDAGDVAEAVLAASAALEASDERVDSEVGDLTDTASGPLARIFTAGPISKVPVTNRSDAELDTLALDELHWALLRRLDGQLTFDQVFRATKIPAIDALKIAAALLRDGVIRVHDRAHH